MPLKEYNIIFTDIFLDYVTDLKTISDRIEYEKKYGVESNFTPVLEIGIIEDKINNIINNTSLFIDKTKRELNYLEDVYNKFLKLTNKEGIKWKIITAQIVTILGTAQELRRITFIAPVVHCVKLAINTAYKRPCKRVTIMETMNTIKTSFRISRELNSLNLVYSTKVLINLSRVFLFNNFLALHKKLM